MLGLPKDILELLQQVQKEVEDKFEVYLAGGYCRDVYCGLTPKDVGIVLVPKVGFEGETISYMPPKFYIQYNKITKELSQTSDMTERGVIQVVGLINKNLSTPEVQFIVYDKHLTMVELMKDFDMTLCEVAYRVSDGQLDFTQEFFNAHKDCEILFTKDYNPTRMYERYVRMKAKFPEYECYKVPETPSKYLGTTNEEIVARATGSFCGDED